VESNFIRVAASVEDQTILQVDPSDTDNIVSGDILVLDFEIEAGISQCTSGNHKVESLIPDG
jgi:uncharacterized membrane-anchored protein